MTRNLPVEPLPKREFGVLPKSPEGAFSEFVQIALNHFGQGTKSSRTVLANDLISHFKAFGGSLYLDKKDHFYYIDCMAMTLLTPNQVIGVGPRSKDALIFLHEQAQSYMKEVNLFDAIQATA